LHVYSVRADTRAGFQAAHTMSPNIGSLVVGWAPLGISWWRQAEIQSESPLVTTTHRSWREGRATVHDVRDVRQQHSSNERVNTEELYEIKNKMRHYATTPPEMTCSDTLYLLLFRECRQVSNCGGVLACWRIRLNCPSLVRRSDKGRTVACVARASMSHIVDGAWQDFCHWGVTGLSGATRNFMVAPSRNPARVSVGHRNTQELTGGEAGGSRRTRRATKAQLERESKR
jgi:hypothetical protein